VTLCYLVGFLCGTLAYVIYGLNIDLCPQDSISYPFAAEINGERVPVQREQVSVFGQIYPFNTTQAFFATQNLVLSDTFKGMEIGSIFNGDTNNACVAYESVPSCSITSPTG
jgi:chitin synthase